MGREPRLQGRAGALLLVLVISGFVEVGPDFAVPEAAVAELASDDPRIATTAPDDARWWQAFDDPALSNLIRIAEQQNPTVQIAGVRVLQARAQLVAAIGDLYPQKQQVFGEVTPLARVDS